VKLWFCLTEEEKRKLHQVYRKIAGRKMIPPKRVHRDIRCGTKIEGQLLSAFLIAIASGTEHLALRTSIGHWNR